MPTILKQFTNRKIPREQPTCQSPEYKQALSNLDNAQKKLQTILSDEGKTLFNEFLDTQLEITYLDYIENSTYYFSLGLTMTAEAFVTINS